MGREWKVGDWAEFNGWRFLVIDVSERVGLLRRSGAISWLDLSVPKHLPDCTGWDWEEPKRPKPSKMVSDEAGVGEVVIKDLAAHEWKFGDWAESPVGIVRFVSKRVDYDDNRWWFVKANGLLHRLKEKNVAYLPDCTGFDWNPPSPVNPQEQESIQPPPGYRLLKRDDIVTYGDILIARDANNCDLWKAVDGDKYGTTVGYFVDIHHIAAFARKIEEQEPIEPPEGFRLMNADETIQHGDMFFQIDAWKTGLWNNIGIGVSEIPVKVALKKYARYRIKAYARRIESDAFKIVEPKYRPFANAEEFMPHRDRWIVDNDGEMLRAISFDAKRSTIATRYGPVHFLDAFSRFKFEDGTPFGVLES